MTDLLGNEWKSVFDNLDRLIESEDARNKKSFADYADGLLTEVHAPANLGPAGVQSRDVGQSRTGRTVKFTHDYAGRTTKVETNDSETSFLSRSEVDFTGFSELYTLVRHLNGNTKTNTWSYDQLGRVTEMLDSLGRASSREYQPYCGEFDDTSPRGISVKSTFDKLCRPKSIQGLNEDIAYEYDELGRLVSVSKTAKSVYADESNPNVRGARYDEDSFYDGTTREWKFEYDPLGRMTRAVYPQGEEALYEYGAVGELLGFTDIDGKVTRYEYNNDLSLRKVVIERTGQPDKEFVYSYDAGGRMTKIIYPDGLELHFDDGTNPGWNANGQLTAMRWTRNSNLIRSYRYDYDDSGNRIQALESNGTPAQDVEWQYRYDWLDRLVQVKKGVGGATPTVQREYVYDESDNRTYMDDFQNGLTFWYTYKTVGSGPNTKYSDELAEVLVATGTGKRAPADLGDFTTLETFVTDDDGNTVSRTTTAGTVSYEWDDFNNLLSVVLENGETTQNSYDADSIREEMVKDSGEKVKSFYSGLPTATETSTLNGNTSYFLGHQLLGYEKNGNSLYYITDGLSSVRAVIDSSGNEVSTFNSDEYGNELNATGTSPKTWVGGLGVHNDTADTRLLYMRRRHYDPKLGRFLSHDPIGLSGGLNLYSYGGNSPVTMVDPTGLRPPSRIVPGLTPTVGLIITGRGASNFYGGHAGLYIEGEPGIYSLNGGAGGIGFNEGVTLNQYLQDNAYRGARVYRIDNLSESQVNLLRESLRNYDPECDTIDELIQYCNGLTCAGVLDYYFEAVGALPPSNVTTKHFPDSLLGRLREAGLIGPGDSSVMMEISAPETVLRPRTWPGRAR